MVESIPDFIASVFAGSLELQAVKKAKEANNKILFIIVYLFNE
jgi:hypothetical protein